MSAQDFQLQALAIAAHPDDAEICCGGLLAKLARLGHRTGILDLTRGELGTRGTVDDRAQEAKRASAILKLAMRENLGLPDGAVGRGSATLSVDDQIAQIVAALRRLRPEILLVPYWEERHPDHVAASKLTTDAIFLAGLQKFSPSGTEKYIPRQVLYYQMRYELPPSFVIDISADIEKKYQAIDCYGSQFGAPHTNEQKTLLNSPLNMSSLKARDAYYGATIGVAAGEAYLTRSVVPLGDPVKHFREFPASESLLFPHVK